MTLHFQQLSILCMLLPQLDEAISELTAFKDRLASAEASTRSLQEELEQERGRKAALERALLVARRGEEDTQAEAERLAKR